MAFWTELFRGEGEEKEEEEDSLSFHSIVTFFSMSRSFLLVFDFFLLSWVLVAARS